MPSFAARKQPQLNLEELLHFRWLLGGALALLSISTLFDLEASIWPAALFASGLILLCLLRPGLPRHVPGWLWRLGVPLIAVFFGVDVLLHDMIPAFVRLNTLLVLHRAVSYRTRREDLQLAALCLFLVIIAGVLTVSLLFAVQILLFTALTLVFLFVVNIVHAATDDEPVNPSTWSALPRRRLLKRLWSVFDLRLVSLGIGLFLAVVVFAGVIFLSIPRFQMQSALGFLQLSRSRSLTGFSEQIALGEVTQIAQDHSIAMRVDVNGHEIVPTVPYWRMVVLDAYERGVFSVSRAITAHVGIRSLPVLQYTPPWEALPGSDPSVASELPAVRLASTQPRPLYTVFLESGISRFLPLPGDFSGLRFTEMQEVIENRYFETIQTLKQSATLLSFQIENADFSGVISDPQFATLNLRAPADHAGATMVDERSRNRYLNYPATTLALPVSAAAHQFLSGAVAEITGDEKLSAAEFARRACAWLARHHRYALAVELPPSTEFEDPVVRWMQANAAGHCEFFAAGFILLSRTAGFPTRAVTGFKGGTWNAYENYYMVRNSDAHAWCEIFDSAGSWLRVDPTPGSSPVSTPADPIALGTVAKDDSLQAYIDSLRMVWYRRIVNFDQGSQQQVVGSMRNISGQIGIWSRALVQTVWSEFHGWMSRPWTLRTSGDLFFYALSLLLITGLMRYFGVGTSDLLAWMRRGEHPTRRRAGDLLHRIRLKLAEPPRRRGRFDPEMARQIEAQLCEIRFGRADRWPAPLAVFRAARRIL